MKAIILAAGMGERLKKFTTNPKCLIMIKNEPLIKHHIKTLRKVNIKDIVIVVGYKRDKVIKELRKYHLKAKVLNNDDFSEGSILSLWTARKELRGDVIVMDADVYYEKRLVDIMVNSSKRNFFLIDTNAKKDSEAVIVGFSNGRAVVLARGLKGNYSLMGEWVGFLRLSSTGSKKLKEIIEKRVSMGERKIGYEFIIPDLFKNIPLSYELTNGLKWVEIDLPKDVKKAKDLNIN